MARKMIVLDTHAVLWWALDPGYLSSTAARLVANMEREGGFASAISIWELGTKIKRGKLEMPIGIDEFARRIEKGGVVTLLPVDTQIWLSSLSLDWDHRDPADRVIVATALAKGLPLLTKDTEIHAFSGVQCVW
jgi:PIN domain nuclease of toxin-antitoxin system